MAIPKVSNRAWHPAQTGLERCCASTSRKGASVLASSCGNSGTTGGGGGITSPRRRRTTQYPRFTALVRRPGELCVRNTAIGSKPPRSYFPALSTRTHVSVVTEGSANACGGDAGSAGQRGGGFDSADFASADFGSAGFVLADSGSAGFTGLGLNSGISIP